MVRNWHALNWETEEKIAKKRSVDKRGVKSDEAYVREVLGEMANAQNLLVINDEAHHAWRVPSSERSTERIAKAIENPIASAIEIPVESKVKGVTKDQIDEATKWVGGLDRIHRARGLLSCYDFSAHPLHAIGQTEFAGGAVRLDCERLRLKRRH